MDYLGCDGGRLGELLAEPAVRDVFVYGAETAYAESGGRTAAVRHPLFDSEDEYLGFLRKFLETQGRSAAPGECVLSGTTANGLKYTVIFPPVAAVPTGYLSLRKWERFLPSMDTLVEQDALTPEAAEYLGNAVHAGANILVFGGSGGGKTATLHALAAAMPTDRVRAVIAEGRDLFLDSPGCQVLRPVAGTESPVTSADLIRTAQRAGVTRLIVDELQGEAASALLSAMLYGAECLASLHAADAKSALMRFRILASSVEGTAGFPSEAIAEGLADSVDILVGVRRLADGRRVVSTIDEVSSLDAKGGFSVSPVFARPRALATGEMVRDSGYRTSPRLTVKFRLSGLPSAFPAE